MKMKTKIDKAIAAWRKLSRHGSHYSTNDYILMAWFRGYEAGRRSVAKRLKALKVFEDDLEKRSRLSKKI